MPALLSPGVVLRSRYKILEFISQGGMGAIYKAEDLRLEGRLCAVKEMWIDVNATGEDIRQVQAQFHREASILARLDHINLPKVSDYFDQNNRDYLVMDFVPGQDLKQLMDEARTRGETLAEKHVLAWAKQILDALEYLHARGVIHRDIKPQNIILTPDGRAMLVDFGLVKVLDPNNPYTATALRGMGTPGYAPIEQYATSTQHTDARTDLYALGATLYFVLTGHEPAEVHQRVINPAALATPRALNPGISAQTESVILRAMEIQPQNRFANATEMKQAFAATTTIPAPPQPPSSPYVPPPAPRQPSALLVPVLAGIAGAVVLLVVVLAIALMARQPNSVALAPTSTTVASASPTAVPITPTATPTFTVTPMPTKPPAATATLLVIVVTATPLPTPTATATPQIPVISPENAAQIHELATLSGHTRGVWSVAFAPDGRTLASGSDDKTIKLWDVASGQLIRSLERRLW